MAKRKPKLQRRERVIHFLTQEEMKRLFGVIKDKRDRTIFLTAYRHGLRASEIGEPSSRARR
jgi:integrase